ncbi:hypothetical protein [Nocardiopsis composta]|uniref:Uncharacterized protein n=1 Tax=Nocardiopsis composta TaxID=157465 RepID=A0A7W8VHM7_9ACTN|nr:hypothetical protein [Nocardiopsis composta]MBB5436330.1 hypothetical protein [Nocardiopsis composta]
MSTEENRVARTWESVRTELVSRTCEWCGAPVAYSGRGPRPKYCSAAHRQRAYEVRTARRRQEEAVEAGTARPADEPVREVIRETTERTVLRTYTQEVPVPVPAGPPAVGRAREVQAYLEEIAAAVREGRLAVYDHRRVLSGVDAVLAALDDAHPGGLRGLSGRR